MYGESAKIQSTPGRAKGILQKCGKDYDETFAPVMSYITKLSFLAVAAYKKTRSKSHRIKNRLPSQRFRRSVHDTTRRLCCSQRRKLKAFRLNTAIYALKQAAESGEHQNRPEKDPL